MADTELATPPEWRQSEEAGHPAPARWARRQQDPNMDEAVSRRHEDYLKLQ
jgi:hypothetical protein